MPHTYLAVNFFSCSQHELIDEQQRNDEIEENQFYQKVQFYLKKDPYQFFFPSPKIADYHHAKEKAKKELEEFVRRTSRYDELRVLFY